MNICVYGSSSEMIDKEYMTISENFGEELTKKGYGLVFGAGKVGLMGAVSRGAKRAGNENIIGVVPKFFVGEHILADCCKEMVYTDTMRQRKQYMEDNSEIFVMLPGGIGTYDEFFEILTLKQLGQHTKQIIIFDINDFFKPLLAFIQNAIDKDFMAPTCLKLFDYCTSSEQVFEAIENYKHDADEDYML